MESERARARERERESAQERARGGGERERERERELPPSDVTQRSHGPSYPEFEVSSSVRYTLRVNGSGTIPSTFGIV